MEGFSPSKRISPWSGESSPVRRLKKVDLPAPLGPTIPMRSFALILTVTPCSTRWVPNEMATSWKAIMAARGG